MTYDSENLTETIPGCKNVQVLVLPCLFDNLAENKTDHNTSQDLKHFDDNKLSLLTHKLK